MLYLPPCWAHDGIAVQGCMTYPWVFRVPQRASLASELALRMTDAFEDATLYKDASQPAATDTPALIPDTLHAFAQDALERLLSDRASLACALGEVMTDPKPKVWFDELEADWTGGPWCLDRRTRMMYDEQHIYINGDSFRAGGADARLMRRLADQRVLRCRPGASQCGRT